MNKRIWKGNTPPPGDKVRNCIKEFLRKLNNSIGERDNKIWKPILAEITPHRTTANILERCPLKYQLVRGLAALDPRHMILDEIRGNVSLTARVPPIQGRWKWCSPVLVTAIHKYHSDKFFFNVVAEKPHFNILWKVVKWVLMLLHGQASIERFLREQRHSFL